MGGDEVRAIHESGRRCNKEWEVHLSRSFIFRPLSATSLSLGIVGGLVEKLMPAFLSLFLPGKFAKEKKLHVSRPSRRRERKMERKNGRMIRIQRKPGPCLRDMLICKNSPVLPMAFVYAFVCRPSFAAVINAANKGNKFDSIEIIFKRGTKWELFPSKELDFSVFLQCYSCQWFLFRNKIFDPNFSLWKNFISQFSTILFFLPMISFEK